MPKASDYERTAGPWRAAGPARRLVASLLAGCLLMPIASHAQLGALERLVMPGPVARAHAQYEQECALCHARFARQSQSQLCLDCHKDVAADIADGKGFHAKSSQVRGRECKACHTDHKGRDADIVGLQVALFDHKLTNFPLEGKHATAECSGCHVPGKPFHAADGECGSCHRKDDRHHGNLGAACADCHSPSAWKDVRFDHTATAHYALTGRHAKVPCAGCHVEQRYQNTANTCVGCHAADDKHHGTNGRECQDCHTASKWSEVSFDHLARTRFPLRGGHAGLMCESCHAGDKVGKKLPADCQGCHAKDDAHDGRNGVQCANCHRVTDWKDVTFDHARDAHFALNGAHANLECKSCHTRPVADARLPEECAGCHAAEDAHQGRLGEACASCHGEVGWKTAVRFDHGLTQFPLLGKHADVACGNCHATKAFRDAPQKCIDCHAADDAHERRLGTDCAMCHNPGDWTRWVFEHDARTHFRLDGAHANLSCDSCHRAATRSGGMVKLATTCGSCHRNDDIHHGEFGQQCERCHVTDSFRALRGLE